METMEVFFAGGSLLQTQNFIPGIEKILQYHVSTTILSRSEIL